MSGSSGTPPPEAAADEPKKSKAGRNLPAAIAVGVLLIALALASLYIQIWLFVAAGLYPHEKKYVVIYLPFSMVLFFSGAAMAFFVLLAPFIFITDGTGPHIGAGIVTAIADDV